MNIDFPLDGKQRHRLRPVSVAFFHSKYALEVLVLIAQEKRVYKAQIAKAVDCQANFAGQFLDRLESQRLVERAHQEDGQTRQYFCKVPSPAWSFPLLLAQGMLEDAEPNVTRLPRRK